MLKATLITSKGKLFVLGLSDENIEQLKLKRPIYVDLREMGGDNKIMIMWGTTPSDMLAELDDAIKGEGEVCPTPTTTPGSPASS